MVEHALGRDDVVALPDARAAVLALPEALDALAAVGDARALVEGRRVAEVAARFHGDGGLVGAGGGVVVDWAGEARGGGEEGEEDGGAHFWVAGGW